MSAPIQLDTPRLVIREFQEEDWLAVHRWGSDPEVSRHMSWGPNTEEETREFVRRAVAARAADPRVSFDVGIEWRETGELVGGCGLYIAMPRHRGAYIGYCLRRDVWGRGIATEAAGALLRFGLEHLGLHRVFATCNTENEASARVLSKIGMRQEAHFRKDRWEKGKWRDTLMFAILEEEWGKRASSRSGIVAPPHPPAPSP